MRRKISLLLILLLIFTNPSVYGAEGVSEWANSEVEEALALGLVPAFLQNNYTDSIKRIEFAHIAAELLNILDIEMPRVSTSVFSDCDDLYVNAIYKLGIISGRGDGSFAPDDYITRQEAAKLLANIYREYTEREYIPGVRPEFSDKADIADWAYEDIGILTSRDIMKGTGDGFEPLGLYTREQSIVTFMRLFKYIKNENTEPFYDNKNPKINDFLKASDGKLISGGKEVILNGVNLGGWLLAETWMSPIEDEKQKMAYSDVIRTLEKRFGKDKTQELISLYEDSFINEKDIENIEKLGFNCVRVPFWYRNFMTAEGEMYGDKEAFRRLDWVIEQCEKRGIWVILDMHGCPGGQSMNHSTGIIGVNGLYENETNLSRMEEIWTRIAERYKDKKCIAAYDIMNEPQNNEGYLKPRAWMAESKTAVELTNKVYDRMIKAIRNIDKKHIITVEGIWSVEVLPNPEDYGWENMMYQLHIYDNTKAMIDYRTEELIEVRDTYGVSVIVGEYNSGELERYATELYALNNISRIKWTYKTVGDWGDWGLFIKEYDKINIEKDSYDKIKSALGEEMITDNGFKLNINEYKNIRNSL